MQEVIETSTAQVAHIGTMHTIIHMLVTMDMDLGGGHRGEVGGGGTGGGGVLIGTDMDMGHMAMDLGGMVMAIHTGGLMLGLSVVYS